MPDRIPVRATRNGGLDYIEVPTQDEAYVAALLRERRGYVLTGQSEWLPALDDELRRMGAEPPIDDETPSTPARRSKR